jgi:hypothetical protein
VGLRNGTMSGLSEARFTEIVALPFDEQNVSEERYSAFSVVRLIRGGLDVWMYLSMGLDTFTGCGVRIGL